MVEVMAAVDRWWAITAVAFAGQEQRLASEWRRPRTCAVASGRCGGSPPRPVPTGPESGADRNRRERRGAGSGATRQRGHCVHLVEAGDYARAVAHAHDGQDSERPGAGGQEGRSAGHGSAGDGCTRAAGQRRRA